MPPATQEGKNTLGFLLNGQPWTPKGFNGTANLSIDFDEGINQGVVGISAYRILSNDNRQYFGIGISDSLNLFSAPKVIDINNASIGRVRFENPLCNFFSTDANTYANGTLSITKLDRSNRIIAGSFNAILFKSGCDTIRITEGRFDMKY